MNLFCRMLGHTWLPETRAPEVRWNTTREGHTLVPTIDGEDVRHLEVCRRCSAERPARPRRHDADRPLVTASAPGSGGEEEPEE